MLTLPRMYVINITGTNSRSGLPVVWRASRSARPLHLHSLSLRSCTLLSPQDPRPSRKIMRLTRPAFSSRSISRLRTCGALALVSFLIPISPPLLGAEPEVSLPDATREVGRPRAPQDRLLVASLQMQPVQPVPASECALHVVQMDTLSGRSIQDSAATPIPDAQTDRNDTRTEMSCTPTPQDSHATASFPDITFSGDLAGQPMFVPTSAPPTLAPVNLPESPQSAEEANQKTVFRLGFNPVDGNWFEREVKVSTRTVSAVQSVKLATLTGLIPRSTLAYTQTNFSASVTVGRNQDQNFDIYDEAELVVGVPEQPVGSLPLSLSYSVSGGWFREPVTPLQTSRVQYLIGFEMPTVALSPKIAWEASGSWLYAIYGNAARQAVLKANATLILRRDEISSMNLDYNGYGVVGATPFAFDAVDPKDLVSDLSLEYVRTEHPTPDVTTSFHDGFSYSFLDRTVSFTVGYSHDAGKQLQWDTEVEYDLVTHETDVTVDYGLPVGQGTNFMLHAKYLGGTTLFKDLDYLITSQIQDCTKLTAKYRQVRQEFWLELDPQSCTSP